MYRGKFTFHSVGQGLFYSGNIFNIENGDRNVFTFVYDCGMQTSARYTRSLRREVSLFRDELASIQPKLHKKRIDLVVISHLDEDHYVGLEQLLRDDVDVDSIIVPYYKYYTRFVVETLLINKKGRVGRVFILVDPRDRDDYYEEQQRFGDIDGGDNKTSKDVPEGRLELIYHNESENYRNENYSRVQPVFSARAKFSLGNPSGKDLDKIWEFVTYNKRVDEAWLSAYIEELDKYFDKHGSLDKIIRSSRSLKEFRKHEYKIGKEIKKSVNDSVRNDNSVVLYHSPLYKGTLFSCYNDYRQACCLFCGCWRPCSLDHYGNRTATLLTGDLQKLNATDIREMSHVIDDSRVDNISIFQVPHHGGHLPFPSQFYCKRFCIVSAGISNRFRHPKADVVEKLLGAQARITMVTEIDCTRYTYEVKPL